MKRNNQIFKFIAAGMLLVASSCSSSNPTPETPLKPLVADPVVATQVNEFSFSFFQTLQETQKKNENIFVSPLSLHIALGMLANGANGETAEEIKRVLRVEGIDSQQLNKAYGDYLTGLPDIDPKVKLHLANSVWYRNSFNVRQSYIDLLGADFKAKISAEDFNDPLVVRKINQWASDNTMGKVPKVIENLDESLVMLLMNALYFKGDWSSQFDKNKTNEANFKLSDGSAKKVQMMFGEHPAKVFNDGNTQAVQLGYGGGEYVLTLLLPKENTSLDEYLKNFDSAEWKNIQKNLFERNVNVGLPRFGLEYKILLNSTLDKMGMPKAFTNAADFSKISEGGNLSVSFVKQDTYLQLDEKGTEAAAVTTIGVELTSTPQKFTIVFDRPFAMIISEKTSDSILFMGRIMNPDSK